MQKLKLCPFCQTRPSLESEMVKLGKHDFNYPGIQKAYKIICHRCGCSQWNRADMEHVIEVWNERI